MLAGCAYGSPGLKNVIDQHNPGLVIVAQTDGSLGTGMIIDDNLILTNYHVIDTPKPFIVTTDDGKGTYDAELVAGDKLADVALIKVKDWEKFKSDHPTWQKLQLRTTAPGLLEDAYAVGHPWGLFYSVSKGIVSSEIRKTPDALPMWMVQTDAHVYQGNSGGPLLDSNGYVIGMNSIMVANSGGSYGLAIPSTLLIKIIHDLEEYKEIRWLYIGISFQDLTVVTIEYGKPGQLAGIKIGDTILGVADNEAEPLVNDFSFLDLLRELSTRQYDKPVWLVMQRDNKEIRLLVNPSYRVSADYLPKK